MNWERQLEQIEREVTAKAERDPAFAELVKSDFQEAVKQATGFDLPFHLLDGLQAPGTEAVSGELTDDQLLEVAGGVSASPIDISGMDIETVLMTVQSERVNALDQALQQQMQTVQNLNGELQQMELLRLQEMINSRNEAFDQMASIIQKMQDARSSIIGNMR